MSTLNTVREFIWPLLEGSEPIYDKNNDVTINDLPPKEKDIETILTTAWRCYDAEHDRRKGIEAKALQFIGQSSALAAISGFSTTILANLKDLTNSIPVVFFFLLLITMYLVRTIYFSIKATESRAYSVISENHFLTNETKPKLIVNIVNAIKSNRVQSNIRMDNVTMAQEYYKRAIIVFGAYFMFLSFIIIVRYFFTSSLNNISIDKNLSIFIAIIALLSLFFNIVFIHVLKKLLKRS